MSLKIGTSNIDGSGSATNLDSSSEVLEVLAGKSESVTVSGEYTASFDASTNSIEASSDTWNGVNTKEVKVDADNSDISVTNFVDVDINAQDSLADIDVSVIDAKRGEVTTGQGNDNIQVSIMSNSVDNEWNNLFVVDSGYGNDSIVVTDSDNSDYTSVEIYAEAGDDVIDISNLKAGVEGVTRYLDGGHGNDTIFGSDSSDTVEGGTGNDSIYGLGGSDIVNAGSGNDFVKAGFGDDVVYGGAGDDELRGDQGNDTIDGGFGNDIIKGDKGDDYLYGGAGNDYIKGGSGSDIIDGGLGDDFLNGGSGLDNFVFDFSVQDAVTVPSFGQDRVADLAVGETLTFSGLFDDSDDIPGISVDDFETQFNIDVEDDGNDVVITMDSENSITLLNISSSDGGYNSLADLENAGYIIDIV